jgi:hypothetical protein
MSAPVLLFSWWLSFRYGVIRLIRPIGLIRPICFAARVWWVSLRFTHPTAHVMAFGAVFMVLRFGNAGEEDVFEAGDVGFDDGESFACGFVADGVEAAFADDAPFVSLAGGV